jgi:hypothetical protein
MATSARQQQRAIKLTWKTPRNTLTHEGSDKMVVARAFGFVARMGGGSGYRTIIVASVHGLERS